MTTKVLELFCGAGSFTYGLNRLGIDHEIVGFCDIRDTAIKVFSNLHGCSVEDNAGDIFNFSAQGMDVDLLTFGSPCQSFTRAGKSEGASRGGTTKSSLMWEAVRVISECTPKVCIWENVPDAINKKHIPNFMEYLEEMDFQGYNTYYEILNANKLGSAQKRSRLFAISIRKDIDDGEFAFIHNEKNPKDLSEYLVDLGKDDLLVEDKIVNQLMLGKIDGKYKIKNATKLGYALADEGDIVDTAFPSSTTRRGRVQVNSCPTLLRSKSVAVIENGTLRYLSPKEYWLLQEFDLDSFKCVEQAELSINQQYDVVGGVINLAHLDVVLSSIKKYI